MGIIKPLPESVRSSVRTGIILFDVTRVVEELVYNSLDAGASKISIFVGTGTSYVKVADDGSGITRDGLVLLGERYVTSKFHDLIDMDAKGRTFGFRGESLASISDVSLVEIITKTCGRANGYRKVMKGCKCLYLGVDDDMKDVGTTVIVRDLFYNQPVRRKQMQSRELTRKSLGGNVIAETLDSLIVLTFEHLESCELGGRLNEVFEILLLSFQRTVLTAYKSKFAQFVIFYACSLDPEVCGARFAVTLADMFVSCNDPPLTRMSAISYLASYLSRGKFLSTSLVTTILKRLVDWCLEYCKTHDGDLNPKAHKIFYSGCQAIMYVLCFRMRSILEIPRLKSQLLLMPIGPVLTQRLNPLKVCLPSIVEEFLRQAKVANLFTPSENFIFNGLLESEYSKTFGGMERLDMFFPYDPCLLKRCDRYLRPHFVYWSMVRPTYDEEEEDEASSEEDVAEVFPVKIEENLMDDDAMARSYGDQDFDLDEFDSALNKMSITPRNSLQYRRDYVQMPSRIRPSMSPESL